MMVFFIIRFAFCSLFLFCGPTKPFKAACVPRFGEAKRPFNQSCGLGGRNPSTSFIGLQLAASDERKVRKKSGSTLALTLALSPGRGNSLCPPSDYSMVTRPIQLEGFRVRRRTILPLLGEEGRGEGGLTV